MAELPPPCLCDLSERHRMHDCHAYLRHGSNTFFRVVSITPA
jgi:hypothetical protein